jgi:hypothetical protein
MTSNADELVPQVQHDFQSVLGYITGSEAQALKLVA